LEFIIAVFGDFYNHGVNQHDSTILEGEQNEHQQQIMTLLLCFTMTLMPTMFSHNKIPQRLPGKMDLVLEFCYTETARVATTCCFAC
jgi:hypothetical protein